MVRKTLLLTTWAVVLTYGTLAADAAFRNWIQRSKDFVTHYRRPRAAFPTKKQLRQARSYLSESPDSTLIDTNVAPELKVELGDHIYLRDANSAMWHIEGWNFDEGEQGCVRRAWNLEVSLSMGSSKKASQVPPALAKMVDINVAERKSFVVFTNEVDALRDLGRLVGDGYTILQPSRNHKNGFVFNEGRCRDPTPGLEKWDVFGFRCPEGAQAIFFQKMIPGVPMSHNLEFWGRYNRTLIVDALEEKVRKLHAAGWVHNDINPTNVLVNEVQSQWLTKYDVELVDFGFSTPLSDDPTMVWRDLENVMFFGLPEERGGYLPVPLNE